jgi:uncharacterized protein (DUF4415 family)
MEVFVRGSRSSAQDWARAQQIPADQLPPLDEQQKAEARLIHRSEEDFARRAYAGQHSQQRLLQRMLRFGRWLNTKVEERSPGSQIEAIELDTLRGKLEICALADGEQIDFEIDEDVVERFLTAGSDEAEKSLFRLLDVFVPRQQVAKAS